MNCFVDRILSSLRKDYTTPSELSRDPAEFNFLFQDAHVHYPLEVGNLLLSRILWAKAILADRPGERDFYLTKMFSEAYSGQQLEDVLELKEDAGQFLTNCQDPSTLDYTQNRNPWTYMATVHFNQAQKPNTSAYSDLMRIRNARLLTWDFEAVVADALATALKDDGNEEESTAAGFAKVSYLIRKLTLYAHYEAYKQEIGGRGDILEHNITWVTLSMIY